MAAQKVELFPGIKLGTTDKPIKFSTLAVPLEPGQYQIWEYELPGDEQSNGCFFIMPPLTETKAGLIIDPDTVVKLKVTSGAGGCVKCEKWNTEEKCVSYIFLKPADELTIFCGDAYRLLSGHKGMVVEDITTPRFRRKITEVTLNPYEDPVPSDFWYWGGTPFGP